MFEHRYFSFFILIVSPPDWHSGTPFLSFPLNPLSPFLATPDRRWLAMPFSHRAVIFFPRGMFEFSARPLLFFCSLVLALCIFQPHSTLCSSLPPVSCLPPLLSASHRQPCLVPLPRASPHKSFRQPLYRRFYTLLRTPRISVPILLFTEASLCEPSRPGCFSFFFQRCALLMGVLGPRVFFPRGCVRRSPRQKILSPPRPGRPVCHPLIAPILSSPSCCLYLICVLGLGCFFFLFSFTGLFQSIIWCRLCLQ